jgi:hypothetical protein
MAKWLTKSNFNAFLIHPAKLWLMKHDPDSLPPWDENAEALAVQGRQIERIARERWENGVLVDGELFDRPEITAALVIGGVEVIFEGAVLTPRKLYAAADALIKQSDGTWDLYEIKSTTKLKAEHLGDIGFQVIAFREAGWNIGRQFLLHVKGNYIRRGALDASQLIGEIEVTDEINAQIDATNQAINRALEVMGGPCPPLDVLLAGDYYKWMEVMRYKFSPLPDSSIFNLCRLTPELITAFKAAHITRLADIPRDFPHLKPQQATQLEAIKNGSAVINHEAIRAELDSLEYPLYFLDYETNGPAIPLYEGTKPYQQIPFQYSLHILDSPSSKLRHTEYLHVGPNNPMPGLIDQLQIDIGPKGSIIVWYKPFETSRHTEMGELYTDTKDYFNDLNKRVFDLMEIFSNGYYADARFLGSASIKAVLPVLVPELSYKVLGIQEGGSASRLWGQAIKGELEPDITAKVYDDLRVYCAQDTLAMVRILEVLRAATS